MQWTPAGWAIRCPKDNLLFALSRAGFDDCELSPTSHLRARASVLALETARHLLPANDFLCRCTLPGSELNGEYRSSLPSLPTSLQVASNVRPCDSACGRCRRAWARLALARPSCAADSAVRGYPHRKQQSPLAPQCVKGGSRDRILAVLTSGCARSDLLRAQLLSIPCNISSPALSRWGDCCSQGIRWSLF